MKCTRRLKGDLEVFHLYIRDKYSPIYWLHIEIPVDSTLEDLDQFIRDIWVECCNHASEFIIGGVHYLASELLGVGPPPPTLEMLLEIIKDTDPKVLEILKGLNLKPFKEVDMKSAVLRDVLRVGMSFDYIYDFGTSTELKLKVISRRKTKPFTGVRLLARNKPPEFHCSICGREATWVCPLCLEQGREVYLCDVCIGKHEHDEEILLPIVNSPRMGVCGYMGSEKYSNTI